MWNNSYSTPTERWQKTSDFPKDTFFFSFFSFCECVCVCFFVWFCLYGFAFTVCPRVLDVRFLFLCFSIVFSSSCHWWICFLVWLLSSFFLFLFFDNYFLIFSNFFLYFILITFLFYFSFFLFFFFLSFIFFSLFFWAVWLTGSLCSGWVSGLCLWGRRAKFRTLVHQRPPSSM